MLGSAESEKVRLIGRVIIFQEFRHMTTIPQRHRQTDGQTDGRTDGQLAMAIPRYA